MKTSERGKALIKRYEGLRLETYRCSANVLTLGYGSTGPHVKEGMVITREEAEKLLEDDLKRFERGVFNLCRGVAEQPRFDALVSFAFNLGLGALQRSTLRQKVNRGDHDQVPAEFMKWTRAAGKVLPGLVKRRLAEAELYAKGGSGNG